MTVLLNTNTTATNNTQAAVNNLLQATQNRALGKVVDAPLFYGRDDEDPGEWAELFEQAHAANG